jgi:RNA polymerase sigma factor (sigma-70 family)
VLEGTATGRLVSSLVYLARARFRIRAESSEDLVQSAILTFLEVRHRYPREDEHARILVGIFRNKCREHIERTVRSARGLEAVRAAADSKRGPSDSRATLDDGVLRDLVHREEGGRILEALAHLRPQAREMFRLITEEGLTRRELMRRFGLNANTLDSRLHTYRRELREALAKRGVSP